MPYIGNVPAEAYSQVSYQDLTGGSGTSFTLDYPVGSAGEIEVFVNNVRQEPTVAYTVNGTALTMTGSVAATDDFYIVFQGKAEKSGTIPEKQTDGTYVFPDDVTVNGNITSTGIDDNATSTAMTLDSSGNLLVGTTDNTVYNNSGSGTGINLQNFGNIAVARDGNDCMVLNRLNSDGPIALFNKDGSTVGSIGAALDRIYFSGANEGVYIDDSLNSLAPSTPSGSHNDNHLDLGNSSSRFKDLYLSGGAYLGGTGSANLLDDYEEGTWTPSFRNGFSGTPTYVNQGARYTKIGRMVYCDFFIRVTGTGNSTHIQVDGLPFTSTSNTLSRGGGISSYVDITGNTFQFYGGININYFSCYINGSSAASISGSITGKYLIGIFTYETDA